jgi:hypothetical protein
MNPIPPTNACSSPAPRRGAAQRSRRIPPFILHPSSFILLFFLSGCGYSNSSGTSGYHWSSLYRQDIQTVHVPIFKNVTFARGMEFALSKAIVNKLEAHTPYKVASQDTADSILEGEITSVRTAYLSQDPKSTLPQEKLMIVTMNFVWKDLRNGRILAQRRSFDQSVTYYPTLGESTFYGSQDAVEKLALGIVHELQADW